MSTQQKPLQSNYQITKPSPQPNQQPNTSTIEPSTTSQSENQPNRPQTCPYIRSQMAYFD